MEMTCDPGPPAISGDFQPITPFGSAAGTNASGNWTLCITDALPAFDAGTWNSYTLAVAYAESNGDGPCMLECPDDIIVDLGPGECEAIVNYTVSTTGNCSGVLPGEVIAGWTGPFDQTGYPEAVFPFNPIGTGTQWVFQPCLTDLSGQPGSWVAESNDVGNCGGGLGWFDTGPQFIAPYAGTLKFDWDYTTMDGPFFDYLIVGVNGVFT
ncbi:MAG: hypothetical protein P8Z37_09930, partial [Acidobacteriota bacterium]